MCRYNRVRTYYKCTQANCNAWVEPRFVPAHQPPPADCHRPNCLTSSTHAQTCPDAYTEFVPSPIHGYSPFLSLPYTNQWHRPTPTQTMVPVPCCKNPDHTTTCQPGQMENKTVRAPCPHCVKQEEEGKLKKGIMPLKGTAGTRKSCWPTIEFFE